MQELEKILEEIEQKKERCLNIVKIEVEPMEITAHRERYKGLCMAEEIIRKHMNDGWIPLEERLPEGGEEVLVQGEFYSRRNNMTYTHIHIMRLNKMTGEWNGVYGVPNGKVIAWKPLSEPYIPEEIETRKELERSEGE